MLGSGADNEIWSYGEENYEIMKNFLMIREKMRPYIRRVMKEISENGSPVIRPLFYDFPDDPEAWNVENTHMFGPDVLVSPVTAPGVSSWRVYLPKGADWVESATGKTYSGGQYVDAYAPLPVIPVFLREGSKVEVY